jgi:hypothetical protein
LRDEICNAAARTEEVLVVSALLVERVRLVHADALRQLPVRLERARLIRHVLQDHVRLLVLEVAQTHQHDVALAGGASTA